MRIVTTFGGNLAVTDILDGSPNRLEKTLFELSRDGTDPLENFDPAVHTVAALASGIPNHRPITHRESTDILPDRYFRNAWVDAVTTIEIDMPKARPIHMTQIRRARDRELVKLDIEFTKVQLD